MAYHETLGRMTFSQFPVIQEFFLLTGDQNPELE